MNNLRRIEQLSVQEHEPASSTGVSYYWFVGDGLNAPDELLPAWGLPSRDRKLRSLYRGVYAWIAQAAVASVAKKVKQTPWQVSGGRNLAAYFQSVLQDADFGDGWGMFLTRVLLDFLTCDYGAYIELIGAGKSDSALRGRVLGIAHLDSLRCQPTGNIEYPVVYWSRRTGKMHRLHYTRVLRLVDMADGDENRFGCGLSALSRAVSALAQQTGAQQYVAEMLNDQPPAGIFYNRGMTQAQWGAAYDAYAAQKRTGYKGFMQISGTDPALGGEILKFAAAPEGFDFGLYTEIAVNVFAAAFGIDRQDIWPLTGRMAGTATQSDILNEKARGMMFGDILQTLERALNTRVLPPSLEFSFQPKDEDGDQQRANRLQAVVNIAADLKTRVGLPQLQVLQFLAAQSDDLRDVLTDASGELVELPDDDVQDTPAEITETDAANQTAADAAIAQDDEPQQKAIPADGSGRYAVIGYFEDTAPITRIQDVLRGLLKADGVNWIEPDTFHVTLAYIEDGLLADVQSALPTDPVAFPVLVDGLRVFDAPNGYAIHLTLRKSGELMAAQASLAQNIQQTDAVLSAFSNSDDYQPHITLAYSPEPVEPFNITPFPLVLKRIEVSDDAHAPVVTQHLKAIQATRLDFESDFADAVTAAQADEVSRRRFGIILRALIAKYGRAAYRDGLAAGGVEELDADDQAAVAQLTLEQSVFVTAFANAIFDGAGYTPEARAAIWYNKSINPFYYAGLRSADRNGLYEWVLGDTEHCDDCLRLAGQKHRYRDWYRKGLIPQASILQCGGFQCRCRLVKTTGAAVGSF